MVGEGEVDDLATAGIAITHLSLPGLRGCVVTAGEGQKFFSDRTAKYEHTVILVGDVNVSPLVDNHLF
jgi:hypothetical protein